MTRWAEKDLTFPLALHDAIIFVRFCDRLIVLLLVEGSFVTNIQLTTVLQCYCVAIREIT